MNGEGAKGFGSVEDMMNERFKEIIEPMNRGDQGSGKDHHNHKIDPTAGRQSIPATTQFDEEIDFDGDHKFDDAYALIRSKILSMASSVRGKIERALAARVVEQRNPLQKRGKLDRRKLARFATDRDFDRPFFKVQSSMTGQSAVTILVDLSGSMNGSKIDAARQAAAVMGEALRGLSIPFEVLGFECVGDDRMSSYSRGLASLGGFNRTEEILSHKIFKSFDRASLSGIAAIDSGHNNADGESLMWAARRLAERRESRKILIVLSDGNPVAQGDQRILYEDLKTKIARIEASGIECVGIGIGESGEVVKKFYKDYVVLKRVSDIVTGCGEKLSKILLQNMDRASA
jgi:cobaltochelatase CobT